MSIRLPAGVALLILPAVSLAQPRPTIDDITWATVDTTTGPTPLHIDLSPNATVATPVVLYIHGGGWQSGSYNQSGPLTQSLLDRGVAVASIEYRLSGQAVFPAQIHDVKGAFRYLRANAANYNLDPLRMATFGTSAGAHLSALAATSGGVAVLEGEVGGNTNVSSHLMTAADWFGPSDLLTIADDVTNPPGVSLDHDAPNSPESRLLGWAGPGKGLGDIKANLNNPAAPYPALALLARNVAPLTHVSDDDPSIFIAHGEIDRTVPINQSVKFKAALDNVGVPAVYMPVPNAGHGNLGQPAIAATVDFLVAQLNRQMGDANLDGVVDVTDLGSLAANFRGSGGWAQGDFNLDGTVDVSDLGLIAANFRGGTAAFNQAWKQLSLNLPEPTAAAPIALMGLFLRRR